LRPVARAASLRRTAAASTLLGAAVVQATLIEGALERQRLEAVLLLVLQVVDSALALALLRRASRGLYVAGIAAGLGGVSLWIGAHAAGLVGRPDRAAAALELAAVVALLPLVVRPRVGGLAGIALVVAAATAVGVSGGTGRTSGHGHAADVLAPGDYPLGEPLHTPTQSRGAGFFFAAWPLPTVVLELGVGPDVVGINTFDVVTVDHLGNRVEPPEVRVTASPPGRARRPLRFRAARLAPGHFVVDFARLPVRGTWRVLVEGRARGRAGRVLFSHEFAVPVGAGADLR
jgi:hypothetical protein